MLESSSLQTVIENLAVGICVWELEEPGAPSSLRLRVCNAAAARFLSVKPDEVVGRRIAEGFPGSLDTPLPGVFTRVIESGEGLSLGDVPYKDEVVPDGVFSVAVHPLGERRAAVEFTNVTEERRAQAESAAMLKAAEAAREETARLLVLTEELDAKANALTEQRREIMTLTSPVIEVWDRVLALPLAGSFEDDRSEVIREKLLVTVSEKQARAVIIDLTGLEAVDERVANELLVLTSALGLLGARAYLTGISPASAQAISSLSRPVPPDMCLRSLKDALAHITQA